MFPGKRHSEAAVHSPFTLRGLLGWLRGELTARPARPAGASEVLRRDLGAVEPLMLHKTNGEPSNPFLVSAFRALIGLGC